MTTYQVKCIRRDGRDTDRRIDRLGGVDSNGRVWNDTIDAVIQAIEQGFRFWTTAHGRVVTVEVRRHPTSGRKFLATENDGFPPNNLLSLPECP